jgi:hypothetical protein
MRVSGLAQPRSNRTWVRAESGALKERLEEMFLFWRSKQVRASPLLLQRLSRRSRNAAFMQPAATPEKMAHECNAKSWASKRNDKRLCPYLPASPRGTRPLVGRYAVSMVHDRMSHCTQAVDAQVVLGGLVNDLGAAQSTMIWNRW